MINYQTIETQKSNLLIACDRAQRHLVETIAVMDSIKTPACLEQAERVKMIRNALKMAIDSNRES